MSFLAQVKTGKIKQPVLMLAYGVDGVGKSTLAASAPKPVFMGTENGTAFLDVARLPSPASFKEALAMLDELATGTHEFQTLAVDSVDWLEPLVFRQVVEDQKNPKIQNIEDLGYGKGYVMALDYWRAFLTKLNAIREKKGMHVILIGHAVAKLFKDPQHQTEYERYQLKLNEKAASLLREAVDYVLFANFEVNTYKDDKKKTRALGEGTRLLYTERRPGFDAKSRSELPFEMPLSWDHFYTAYTAELEKSPTEVIARINGFMDQMPPQALPKIKESISSANNDLGQLERILNRVRELAAKAS